ncbi:MAG: putative ABC transporter permease [Peptostreptococcus sp.]|uniref:putative ABC transporter permease n=1 Tax=Peptostreptococcus sp. TaxID=1262 RepID=UPI002FC7F2C5
MEQLLNREVIEFIMYFFIYAFLGWLVEVSYHALKCGKFINRGMLAGAVCPIYGFGAVIIVYFLEPVKDNIFLLFIGSAILCSVLEYLAGLILDKLFHKRWWDYSDVPFNLGGYISLQFTVYWGIGGIILIRDVQELIEAFVALFNTEILFVFSAIFAIIMLIDALATVASINKFNRKLELLSELQGQIHKVSDVIGENVSEGTLEIVDRGQPIIDNIESKTSDIKEKSTQAKREFEGRKDRLVYEMQERSDEKKKEKEDNKRKRDLAREKFKKELSHKIYSREVKLEKFTVDKLNKLYRNIYGKDEFTDNKNYTVSELKEKKKEIHGSLKHSERRLLKAFPDQKEHKREEEFNEIKEKLKDK